jgi:predicted chitinase
MDEGLSVQEYEQILPHVLSSLEACECTNENRIAMWMAQIGHESAGLRYSEELGDDAYFAQYNNRSDLGNRPGTDDGVVYHGRSYIQTTGRANYEEVSKWAYSHGYAPSNSYFVDRPEKLAEPEYAFQGVNYYWVSARPKINAMADAGDLEGVTRAINGGTNGIEDRAQRYERAQQVASAVRPGGTPATPTPPSGQATCLTGRPHHHSECPPPDQLLLDMRAEGLLTQALAYAIAEKAGIDARALYDQVRGSF